MEAQIALAKQFGEENTERNKLLHQLYLGMLFNLLLIIKFNSTCHN